MTVKIIVEENIVKGKKKDTFRGQLFYTTIPDSPSKAVTFYYTRVNYTEGRSVVRALSLFIRDYLKVDPTFFLDLEAITSALNGEWDYATRKFMSTEEKMECNRLDTMKDEVNAEVEVYISKYQQRAFVLNNDTAVSDKTRLTKGGAAPPATKSDEVSEMINFSFYRGHS